MTTVRIADNTVDVSEQGHVTWKGRAIGRVYKGTRTYSPPTHKGSRIAKYHKQVPCWYATDAYLDYRSGRDYQCDTRQQGILWLIRRDGERHAPHE